MPRFCGRPVRPSEIEATGFGAERRTGGLDARNRGGRPPLGLSGCSWARDRARLHSAGPRTSPATPTVRKSSACAHLHGPASRRPRHCGRPCPTLRIRGYWIRSRESERAKGIGAPARRRSPSRCRLPFCARPGRPCWKPERPRAPGHHSVPSRWVPVPGPNSHRWARQLAPSSRDLRFRTRPGDRSTSACAHLHGPASRRPRFCGRPVRPSEIEATGFGAERRTGGLDARNRGGRPPLSLSDCRWARKETGPAGLGLLEPAMPLPPPSAPCPGSRHRVAAGPRPR